MVECMVDHEASYMYSSNSIFFHMQVLVVATNAQVLESVVIKLTDLFGRLVS